jgi:endonuclease III
LNVKNDNNEYLLKTDIMNDWEKIVCLILSVNRWDLSKTLDYYEKLKEKNLFDPGFIAQSNSQDLGNRLKEAGYDRGSLTFMMSGRLVSAAKTIIDKKINVQGTVLETESEENRKLLLSLSGLGEKSVSDFYRIIWNQST